MGLCALVLCVAPAANATSEADLGGQLARHVAAMQKNTSVIRFFEEHGGSSRTRGSRRKRRSASPPRDTASPWSRGEGCPSSRGTRLACTKGAEAAPPRSRRAVAESGDLQRLRLVLRRGAPGRALRVELDDDRPERPVPRPLPDGLERAAALRSRRDRDRAGKGGLPVLRPFGTGLEPVVVQALELTRAEDSCGKCGTRLQGRVPSPRRGLVVEDRAVLAEGRPPPASRRGSSLRALPRRPGRVRPSREAAGASGAIRPPRDG